MAGIAHFSNFFRFMEAAEVDLLHSLGLSVRLETEGLQLGFPRVSASCDYLRPVTFEDVLDIDVRVEKIGRKSVTFGFDFFCRETLVARGKVTSVCCRVGANRELEAVAIPPALLERLRGGRPVPEEPVEGL
jgi:YbgC/YbaW family acyl-CoA thioester hydrolase